MACQRRSAPSISIRPRHRSLPAAVLVADSVPALARERQQPRGVLGRVRVGDSGTSDVICRTRYGRSAGPGPIRRRDHPELVGLVVVRWASGRAQQLRPVGEPAGLISPRVSRSGCRRLRGARALSELARPGTRRVDANRERHVGCAVDGDPDLLEHDRGSAWLQNWMTSMRAVAPRWVVERGVSSAEAKS